MGKAKWKAATDEGQLFLLVSPYTRGQNNGVKYRTIDNHSNTLWLF